MMNLNELYIIHTVFRVHCIIPRWSIEIIIVNSHTPGETAAKEKTEALKA